MSTLVCHTCKNLDNEELVRACNTKNCDAIFHPKCLVDRFNSGKKSCPECELPIITRKTKTFNWNKCFKLYFNVIYTFIMVICGTYLNINLVLGELSNPYNWDNSGRGSKGRCDVPIVFLFSITTILWSLIFWQFPIKCYDYDSKKYFYCCRYKIVNYFKPNKNNNKDSYLTMFLLYLVSSLPLYVIQKLGQYELNDYGTFNPKTFISGIWFLISSIFFLIKIIAVILVISLPFIIIIGTLDKFTITKTYIGKKLQPLPNNISKSL